MKSQYVILITALVIFLLAAGGAYYVDKRLGDKMNLPSLSELIQTQPEIMPGMELPKLGPMPELEDFAAWINSEPLTRKDLEGKVVLIDFMTYSCINCIRTWPFINSWHEKYKDDGLLIIGIHTPEFQFEKDEENVRKAMKDAGIEFPVALDNNYTTWRNFNNRFWPAKYLFDKDGILRYTHFGEGKYDETERIIQELLGQTNGQLTEAPQPDFSQVHSPETYFGYARGERFASAGTITPDESAAYTIPEALPLNAWALGGEWIITREYSETLEEGTFQYQFNAGNVGIVLASADGEDKNIEVLIDGSARNVTVSDSNLYRFGPVSPGEHLIEVRAPAGVQFYAIVFGSDQDQ